MKTESVKIAALDDHGNGMAFRNGEKIIIPYSIPGETWQISPQMALLEPSSDRVHPLCPYFTLCGGCQLQHMSEARQIAEKQAWLNGTLGRVVDAGKILPVLPSPKPFHYRRRIQLHVGPKGEVGFYATKSRQVIPIEACSIADEELNAKILEVRKRAKEALQGPKKPSSLSFELTLLESGEVEISQNGEGRSFLQVNPEANQLLIEVLGRQLETIRPQRVLELFAGSGNLSFPLSAFAEQWVAVESNGRAVEAGKARGETKIQWHQGHAAKIAERLYQSGQRFDLVILDPPRGGAEDCLPIFRRWKPGIILYVSCHAPILKKDLLVLAKSGYQVESLQPIDFFPQTMNLETVALLRHSTSFTAS